jgi:predicted phosphodiesterase
LRPLRTIGAIGDIHAEERSLAAALEHHAREGVDAVLAVGDIVDGQGSVVDCCRLLREAGAVVVRGNHERWILRGEMRSLPYATDAAELGGAALAFLEALPATRVLDTVAGRLLLCHGLGEDDMVSVREDDFGYALQSNDPLQRLLHTRDVAIVVNGHTHARMVRSFDGLTIVNAGTLCRDHRPCFARLDLAAGAVTFYDLSPDHRVTGSTTVELFRDDASRPTIPPPP